MKRTVLIGACIFFTFAAIIDVPVTPPDRRERNWGNFCCSMGFVLLTLAQLLP